MHSSDCLSRQTTNSRRYCISSLLITWHSSCHYSLCFKHVSCLSGHSLKNAVPLYRKKCCQWLAISSKWLMQKSSSWENIVIGNETSKGKVMLEETYFDFKSVIHYKFISKVQTVNKTFFVEILCYL